MDKNWLIAARSAETLDEMELNSVEREVEREEFRAPAREGQLQIGHQKRQCAAAQATVQRVTVQ